MISTYNSVFFFSFANCYKISKGSGEMQQYLTGIQSCFLTIENGEMYIKKTRLMREYYQELILCKDD